MTFAFETVKMCIIIIPTFDAFIFNNFIILYQFQILKVYFIVNSDLIYLKLKHRYIFNPFLCKVKIIRVCGVTRSTSARRWGDTG